MKERPILFNGEMVRAILEGRKTQTRRLIKPQPPECYKVVNAEFKWSEDDSMNGEYFVPCPFGKPGDRLWVREGHRYIPGYNKKEVIVQYQLDTDPVVFKRVKNDILNFHSPYKWRPSIHMKREHSRITLEITDVRVERVQDISEWDAQQEGIIQDPTHGRFNCGGKYIMPSAVKYFAGLWDSVYKNWQDNPWVFVVDFKRIDP